MNIISFLQIAISIIVIVLILLQERGGGLGGAFGGGGGGGGGGDFYQQRRGMEKFLFYGTIVLVILFAGLALLNLLV